MCRDSASAADSPPFRFANIGGQPGRSASGLSALEHVTDGVATLRGFVTMPFKSREIAGLTSRVDGVQDVVDKVESLPVSGYDDQIRYAIASRIWDAGLWRARDDRLPWFAPLPPSTRRTTASGRFSPTDPRPCAPWQNPPLRDVRST